MPNQFSSPEGDLENYFVSESWLIDQYVGDTLWVWGYNNFSQLGVLTSGNRTTPVTTFSGGANWKQVASGIQHMAAIKTDGTLWNWGGNTSGQLGINSIVGRRCTPVQVSGNATNWKQVSCGVDFTAAIKTDGTLWTWGINGFGQLGINVSGIRSIPVTVFGSGTNWKLVNCGKEFAAAIKTDGTLWTWGNNNIGQLGINVSGTGSMRCTPVQEFTGATNWKQVACGYSHTAAIKTDGTLWTWGYNRDGQLGFNVAGTGQRRCTPVQEFTGATNWKRVSCGSQHTVAIKTDGTLWTWGYNSVAVGQLGINIGINTMRCTPVTTFVGGTNWKQVTSSVNNTAAIKTDGTLWGWGSNTVGQLGVNDINPRCIPVTTFIGGTNWKQVGGCFATSAITSGTDPTYFIS